MPADVTRGAAHARRRYTQGNARSKTIELGTLSEIEEDIYHNKEEVCDQTFIAAEANGTIRRPTNGTVKSLARHLSERQKEQTRTTTAASAFVPPVPNDAPMPGVSHEEAASTVKFRQPPCVHFNGRAIRCFSEFTDLRRPLAKWSPPPPPLMHHLDEKCNPTPHPSMCEFHPRAVSTAARSHATRAISRSSSMTGGVLVYDPRTMSLMDPRLATEVGVPQFHDYPGLPMWYPLPAAQPPPLYIPLGPPVMPPLPPKMMKPPKRPSVCAEMCCGGVAQMLWTLICIVLLGVVGVLITALLYL